PGRGWRGGVVPAPGPRPRRAAGAAPAGGARGAAAAGAALKPPQPTDPAQRVEGHAGPAGLGSPDSKPPWTAPAGAVQWGSLNPGSVVNPRPNRAAWRWRNFPRTSPLRM